MQELSFRNNYDKKVNKVFIGISLAHIPVFVGLAYFFKTQISIAILAPLLIAAGPIVAYLLKPHSKLVAALNGFAMMALSGVMIHLGKGMIEMHFHIFAFIAFLIFYGRIIPLLVALATVAVHHIGFFFLLPKSLFNYDATFGIVLVHAAFAIVSAVGCSLIARKLGVFIDVQETVMTNLKTAVDKNKNLSEKLNNLSSLVTDSSNLQASSIQETVTTLEEISRMVEMTNNSIQETESISTNSVEIAEKGKASVNAVTNSIQEISNSNEVMVKELNNNIDQIQKVTQMISQIAEKTSIINDIVFQTKLLSFNASVEAARAGEHGKGFAVVAEEVGNLASVSGKASEEINSLLENSKNHVNEIVKHTKENMEKISTESKNVINLGIGKSSYSLEIINSVVDNIKRNTDLMKNISTASSEQSVGVQEITEAIRAIDRTNQENIQITDQLSHLSGEMDNESINLDKVVDQITCMLENKLCDRTSGKAQERFKVSENLEQESPEPSPNNNDDWEDLAS